MAAERSWFFDVTSHQQGEARRPAILRIAIRVPALVE
jgi:hypothetical protein